ncbi:hypothetical protein BsWGS_10981 [Bradybaena similaris]
MAVNVRKLYQEYLQCNDQLDSRRRDVQVGDIRLDRVKLEVVKTEWLVDKFESDEQETCSTNNLEGEDTTAIVSTENENSATVTLKQGIVQGLNNTTFQLELNPQKCPRKKELTEAFGDYLTVDHSKEKSEHPPKKPNMKTKLVGKVGPSGATAKACKISKKYTGSFVCTVIMKGKCLANGSEQQIGDVISQMKSALPRNPDLKAMSVTQHKGKKGCRNAVQFEIKGDLACSWDSNERMELKQN